MSVDWDRWFIIIIITFSTCLTANTEGNESISVFKFSSLLQLPFSLIARQLEASRVLRCYQLHSSFLHLLSHACDRYRRCSRRRRSGARACQQTTAAADSSVLKNQTTLCCWHWVHVFPLGRFKVSYLLSVFSGNVRVGWALLKDAKAVLLQSGILFSRSLVLPVP